MKKHWPASTHSWAMRIMDRESKAVTYGTVYLNGKWFGAKAQNTRSTAAGCFQLLRMHAHRYNAVGCSWAERYNAHCNVKAAYHLYREAGRSPWNF